MRNQLLDAWRLALRGHVRRMDIAARGAAAGLRHARREPSLARAWPVKALIRFGQLRASAGRCGWRWILATILSRACRQGQPIGYDIDLARAVGQKLGLAVEFVPSNLDSIYDDLANHKADMAASALPYAPEQGWRASLLDLLFQRRAGAGGAAGIRRSPAYSSSAGTPSARRLDRMPIPSRASWRPATARSRCDRITIRRRRCWPICGAARSMPRSSTTPRR